MLDKTVDSAIDSVRELHPAHLFRSLSVIVRFCVNESSLQIEDSLLVQTIKAISAKAY